MRYDDRRLVYARAYVENRISARFYTVLLMTLNEDYFCLKNMLAYILSIHYIMMRRILENAKMLSSGSQTFFSRGTSLL